LRSLDKEIYIPAGLRPASQSVFPFCHFSQLCELLQNGVNQSNADFFSVE
jgi:hypothetical protein